MEKYSTKPLLVSSPTTTELVVGTPGQRHCCWWRGQFGKLKATHQASGIAPPYAAVVGVLTNNLRHSRWWWGHQASDT